ncbi:MAG: M23 family metallopeptidase [Pseudomonadota bacterium]
MRPSFLVTSSLTLVAFAGAAVADAAFAQNAVPVVYGTNPGSDRPAYPAGTEPSTLVIGEAAALASPAASAPLIKASFGQGQPYAKDPIYNITHRQSIEVQAGDTVYAVARRYGLSPTDIIHVNGLSAPYNLKIGQQLFLPAQKAPAIKASAPKASSLEASSFIAHANLPAATSTAPSPQEVKRLDSLYTVRPGDTLYSLSRQFQVDLVALASANGLQAPYSLSINQRLVIPGANVSIAPAQTATPNASQLAPMAEPILVSKAPGSRFAWPLQGSIVRQYGMSNDGVRNDGINIAAPVGAPIRASADGEVVYTGSELEGYGNLLLIRHEEGWVSAYAHTDDIIVNKGDRVRQGQVVAKVGKTGAVDQSQLHFELRHELKPRDPIAALNGTDYKASMRQ